MTVTVEKIPGGIDVDSIKLRKGKCGCASLAKCVTAGPGRPAPRLLQMLFREDKEGAPFEELPDAWRYLVCGARKDAF